jgi:hypothetical protein
LGIVVEVGWGILLVWRKVKVLLLLLLLLEFGVVVGFDGFWLLVLVLRALLVLGESFGAWEGEAEDEGVVWWFWLGLRLRLRLLFLSWHDVGLLDRSFRWFGIRYVCLRG